MGHCRQGRAGEIKDVMRFVSQYRFSPTGVFEQDDMDNWIQVTGAARSLIGRRFPANYQMGVTRRHRNRSAGRLNSRFSDKSVEPVHALGEVLQAKNWSEIRAQSMDSELRHQVEDFLYLEAELLDERKFREWLELFTDDIRYWMPVRHNPLERPESSAKNCPGRAKLLFQRRQRNPPGVERPYSKIAWAEMPPSRTRHLISNVRIKNDDGREFEVDSNFIVYRTRMERDKDIFVGARKDVLRRANGELKSPGERLSWIKRFWKRKISVCFL